MYVFGELTRYIISATLYLINEDEKQKKKKKKTVKYTFGIYI